MGTGGIGRPANKWRKITVLGNHYLAAITVTIQIRNVNRY